MATPPRRGCTAATLAHRPRACEENRGIATLLWWQEDTGRGGGGELQDADLADIQSLHSPTNKSLNSLSFCLLVVIYIDTDTEELLVGSLMCSRHPECREAVLLRQFFFPLPIIFNIYL